MKNLLLISCISLFTSLSWSQCEDFEMTITSYNPTCHHFCDGAIFVVTSGGVGPMEVVFLDSEGNIWTPGPGTEDHSLCSGCYDVIVTDSMGCELTDSVCLINPDLIEVDLLVTSPTYPGACDGIVEADTVYGYQGAYESIGYFWTIPDVPFESLVTDVCAGEYMLTINDEFGCSGVFDFALGSLAEIPLNANLNVEVFFDQTTGDLIVKNSNENSLNIKLLSMSGQVVFDSEISSEITTYSPNLNTGIYLYTITQNQEIIQTGKLAF
jgi:hypothetical protein